MAFWTTNQLHTPNDALYRAFVKNYLSKPDPVAWLAAADYLDEAGGSEGAYAHASQVWRKRGEWYPALKKPLDEVRSRRIAPLDERLYLTLDGWRCEIASLGTYVRLRWRAVESITHDWRKEHRVLIRATSRRYLVLRTIQMIDEMQGLATAPTT